MAGMRSKAYAMSAEMRAIYGSDPRRPDAPGAEMGWNAALTARVRFGDWDEILADAAMVPSPESRPYAVVLRHYSTGLALLHRGSQAGAEAELRALRELAPRVSSSYVALTRVANLTLSAAVALRNASVRTAVAMLQAASDEQMSWHYDEPPRWHFPVTQCLGWAQLKAGSFVAAQTTFLLDLKVYPQNGFGLAGLKAAALAAGDDERAREAEEQLDEAWTAADVPQPRTSCAALDF